MTERKPAGIRFESWVERQIREAQERGEFDNLAGAGKPLPGLTGHYDDMWWVKQVVQREHLSLLPPMLALRKEAEELLAGLADVPSERAVRDQVEDYNARVVAAIRQPRDGPLVMIPRRLDIDEVVAEWARLRSSRQVRAIEQHASSVAAESDPVEEATRGRPMSVPRPRWRRRLWRRRALS